MFRTWTPEERAAVRASTRARWAETLLQRGAIDAALAKRITDDHARRGELVSGEGEISPEFDVRRGLHHYSEGAASNCAKMSEMRASAYNSAKPLGRVPGTDL